MCASVLFSDELKSSLEEMDRAAEQLNAIEGVPIQHRSSALFLGLWDIIDAGEADGAIRQGQTVLDMGSGSGSSSLIWASRGYDVTGIELDKRLFDCSCRSFEQILQTLPLRGSVTLRHGSYFPEEYIALRESGHSSVLRYEADIRNRFGAVMSDVLHIVPGNLVDISHVDILYAYAWPIQVPSILEMFSRFALRGSILVLVGEMPDDLLETLGLVVYPKFPFVRKA